MNSWISCIASTFLIDVIILTNQNTTWGQREEAMGTQFAAMNKNNCLIMKTIQIVSICVDINIAHGWYAKIQSCDWSNFLLAPLEAAYLQQLRPIMAPIGATKYFTKFFCRRLIKILLWQFPHHWSLLRRLNSISSLIFFWNCCCIQKRMASMCCFNYDFWGLWAFFVCGQKDVPKIKNLVFGDLIYCNYVIYPAHDHFYNIFRHAETTLNERSFIYLPFFVYD